jgi:hypothetical protein
MLNCSECAALHQLQLRFGTFFFFFCVCHSIPFIITASSFIIRGAVSWKEEEEERNDSEKDNSNFGCGSGELKKRCAPLTLM